MTKNERNFARFFLMSFFFQTSAVGTFSVICTAIDILRYCQSFLKLEKISSIFLKFVSLV